MRCIEITSSTVFEDGFAGLTLTWDVLKCNCKTGATYNDND